jgi:hypothetical protein
VGRRQRTAPQKRTVLLEVSQGWTPCTSACSQAAAGRPHTNKALRTNSRCRSRPDASGDAWSPASASSPGHSLQGFVCRELPNTRRVEPYGPNHESTKDALNIKHEEEGDNG